MIEAVETTIEKGYNSYIVSLVASDYLGCTVISKINPLYKKIHKIWVGENNIGIIQIHRVPTYSRLKYLDGLSEDAFLSDWYLNPKRIIKI